jgi:hypothetical protein
MDRFSYSTHATAAMRELRQAALTEMLKRPWLDSAQEACVFPPPDSPLVPALPVYPGLGCHLCGYVCHSISISRPIQGRHILRSGGGAEVVN